MQPRKKWKNGRTPKTEREEGLSIRERLSRRLLRDGLTTCWLFDGALNSDGYGHIRVEGKTLKVHVVSFREFKGEVPPGLGVLHTCDVRACWNPGHLFAGNQKANMEDMQAKGRVDQELQRERMRFAREHPNREPAWREAMVQCPGKP